MVMKKWTPQESMEELKKDEFLGKYIVEIPQHKESDKVTPTPGKTMMNEKETDNPKELAWNTLKLKLDSANWSVGESADYAGFFSWGWDEALKRHAAPAPPEDEPIGYIHIRRGSLIPIASLTDKGTLLKDGTPLYTRPANDGLRKAAEEVVKEFDVLLCGGGGSCGESIRNLRSALDKDKS